MLIMPLSSLPFQMRHEIDQPMSDTKPKLGRPRIHVHAMTPAQRAKRYRDKKRESIMNAAYRILAYLAEEAAKPFDRAEHEVWQQTLAKQADRIERDYRKSIDKT